MADHEKLDKWLSIIGALAPMVLMNMKGGEKLVPFVPAIVHGIQVAEQLKGATGAEKKGSVIDLVKTSVTVANATGKVSLDPAELTTIASNGIDLAVKVANEVHKSHAPGQPD